MRQKYIVAVSGGVDSVVLLDMQARKKSVDLVVAHFDHGVRGDSADDARFVAGLANRYGLPFETRREELGPTVSEDHARHRRYAFLRSVAKKHSGVIMTAHHADDVVETVAINIQRGTGWRGLAVLDSDVSRPLLAVTKQQILQYAAAHNLQWREDSTNRDNRYLRNRLRAKLKTADTETKEWVRDLRDRQVALKTQIDNEAKRLVPKAPYSRYFFTHIDDRVAIELLRTVFMNDTGASPTIPQRRRALHAIKVAKPGSRYDVAAGIRLQFTRTEFVVDQPR